MTSILNFRFEHMFQQAAPCLAMIALVYTQTYVEPGREALRQQQAAEIAMSFDTESQLMSK